MFVAPLMAGGREAAHRGGGAGVEQIAARRGALHPEVERIDDDVLIIGPAEGVVRCSPGSSQATGTVARLARRPAARSSAAGRRAGEGDSVAVNGVCLTAVDRRAGGFAADVMDETLRRTSLGALGAGDAVNLELPLRAGDRLGGHIVQGHVDGVGTWSRCATRASRASFASPPPPDLLRYVVEKGSIAVDGVSLTVARWTTTASRSR